MCYYIETLAVEGEKAVWMWYPGDMEVWLHNEVGYRRQEKAQTTNEQIITYQAE